MTRLFFRADGSSSIGLGHVYRSCALADMLNTYFECHFIIRNALPELHQLIRRYCLSVINLETESFDEPAEARQVAGMMGVNDILVLDGYHFKTDYQRIIKDLTNCKLVSIDDIHACYYLSDAVISHIGGLTPANFRATFYTEFYLGPRYALIRKEFIAAHGTMEQGKLRDGRLLLFLGGSDPANDTLGVLRQLPGGVFNEIHVITGAGYRYQSMLEQEVAIRFPNVTLHHCIEADAVRSLMEACGYAILAPSTVSYEYMSLGGIVFLCQIADNQTAVKDFYLAGGLAEDISNFRILSEAEKTGMLTAQERYFDGKSPMRLLRLFQSLELAQSLRIRNAELNDMLLVYGWVNDSQTRQMSYHTETVPLDSHKAWFQKKISASGYYYILESNGDALGQIRFEPGPDGEFVLGFLVAPEFRGMGLGAKVLAEGMKLLKKEIQGRSATISGYVKKCNTSSAVSFERLAFVRSETDEYPESYKYSIVI